VGKRLLLALILISNILFAACDAPAIVYVNGLQTQPNDEKEITFEDVKTGGLEECEKFLEKHPKSEHAEQVELWKAILADEDFYEDDLTYLPPQVAKALTKYKGLTEIIKKARNKEKVTTLNNVIKWVIENTKEAKQLYESDKQ